MKKMLAGSNKPNWGFSLVELLVVISVITILASLLVVAVKNARLKAKVVKVHGELKSLADGIEMYYNDYEIYPPARSGCVETQHHHEYSIEVVKQRYVDVLPKDIFNTGPKYKYVAPGPGWVYGFPGQPIRIWVPKDYPDYQGENNDKGTDRDYWSQSKSPVKWALWSVGPYGALPFWESTAEQVPVPKRTWYEPGKPKKSEQGTVFGVITRLSDGRTSP